LVTILYCNQNSLKVPNVLSSESLKNANIVIVLWRLCKAVESNNNRCFNKQHFYVTTASSTAYGMRC